MAAIDESVKCHLCERTAGYLVYKGNFNPDAGCIDGPRKPACLHHKEEVEHMLLKEIMSTKNNFEKYTTTFFKCTCSGCTRPIIIRGGYSDLVCDDCVYCEESSCKWCTFTFPVHDAILYNKHKLIYDLGAKGYELWRKAARKNLG